MKRKWNYPEPVQTRSKMVRGLGELQDTPEFRNWLEREFPAGSAEMESEDEQNVSRRSFMRLMGASTALAGFGVAACRRPEAHILAYSKAPEWVIPGNALYYATSMPRLGGAQPMVVTTHEGRPTHLEGNPLHPGAKGLDTFASSSILDLYCPERSGKYLHKGEEKSAEDFQKAFAGLKGKLADGKGLAVLVGESTSPTRARALKKFGEKFPAAKVFSYEAINNDTANAAHDAILGKGVRPVYDFSKAKRVLSIGCDFLGTDRLSDDAITAFSRARRVDDTDGDKAANAMNRLYTLEHTFTLTGGMADHRLPVNASLMLASAAAIAKEIASAAGDSALSGLASAAGNGEGAGLDATWVSTMVKDLVANKGATLVLAGPRLDADVHALVAGINAALQSFGSTIKPVQTEADESGSLADLEKAIKANQVDTLVITTDADPVYDAPSQNFGDLLKSVANVISVNARHKTATARAATWHVPGTHYLESWGDVRSSDGTYSIVQPMIMPLYGGISELSFLLDLMADPPKEGDADAPAIPGVEPKGADLLAVEETFAEVAAAAGLTDVPKAWDKALRDGFAAGTEYKAAAAQPNIGAGKALIKPSKAAAPSMDAFEVVFTADSKVYDGRYINNAWQQEAPDPISKVVWDNAALISVRTLSEMGISQKDIANLVDNDRTRLLKVELNGKTLLVPFLAVPGHSQHSLTISLGYGQTDPGKVGNGTDGNGAGFNVYPLRTAEASYIATGAKVTLVDEKVEPTGREGQGASKTFPIALTQQHSSMEDRAIVRDGTQEEFEDSKKDWKGKPDKPVSVFQKRGMDSHAPENISIYKGQTFDYETMHQWGMAIDLNSCIGCNSCLVSCQSENNIPVVGKEQVIIGREMHWIRMDRYFAVPTAHHDHPAKEDEKGAAGAAGAEGEGGEAHHDDHGEADMDNPQMLTQPMACQHCESAPCETVCPVNATVHSEEGLNTMAYNRCIGTRYCMNNCPYKARRFNFFDYNKRPTDQLYLGPLSAKDETGVRESVKLQKNPNVTVRMRGVVEKCTYCVQRLQDAKIKQKQIARDSKDIKIKTNSVKTACQTACPAEAITFGDLGNKENDVVKWKDSPRNYDVLHFLGTRPRTSYLARLKNPNHDMPGADLVGTVTTHMH